MLDVAGLAVELLTADIAPSRLTLGELHECAC